MIRLLVADDDALVRSGLTTLLRAEPDIEVVGEAGDGISATDLIVSTVPDVVLLDVRMPKTSGLALQEQLTKLPYCPPIIIMTGHAEVPTALRAMRQGAVDFLQTGTAQDPGSASAPRPMSLASMSTIAPLCRRRR